MTVSEAPARLPVLDEQARALLFSEARTVNAFTDEPVSDETLRSVWELAKWPPTAINVQPLRVTFVRTPAGKQRLVPLLSEGNRAKTAAAPAVALLAADTRFHEYVSHVAPHVPQLFERFEQAPAEQREAQARFNATLQAAYFILAARAHGLGTGPMGGFDADAVDREFFPGGRYRTLLVVNLGHPAADGVRPRQPRLAPDDVLSWA